jgi:glucose-6-phosphate isomerase|eukprot:SAG25_NODE_176_length_12787_cov_14.980060_6_plen_61_part_00
MALRSVDSAFCALRFLRRHRVSVQLLLHALTPGSLGRLLAIYEHRTAVQGAVWGINSFDQ